jgi:hypothetical protein
MIIKGQSEDGGVIKALYFEPIHRNESRGRVARFLDDPVDSLDNMLQYPGYAADLGPPHFNG